MRLSATKALMERRDVIIIASVSAIYGLGDPEILFENDASRTSGDVLDQRDIPPFS